MRQKIYNNLFWILLILGMLILYVSSWNVFNDYLKDILEKIGLSILSSGVFAAVLKSIQFTGIFKKEIEEIILSSDFMEKRNDLPALWKRISKGVYKQKFPEISDLINDSILGAYFPTNYEYYYRDFRYTMDIIELDTKEGVIKFTQTVSYEVVLEQGVDSCRLNHRFYFDKGNGLKELKYSKEYLKIDNVDVLKEIEEKKEENDFEVFTSYELNVTGKNRFRFETKEYREYCIKEDNFKLTRVNTFTKNMDVSISYPSNMTVSFFNIGLIESFERQHIEHKNRISRVHKNGLIMPLQGFGITFAEKQ